MSQSPLVTDRQVPFGAFAPPASSPEARASDPVSSPAISAAHHHNNITPAHIPAPTAKQASQSQMTNPLLNLLKFGSNAASPQGSPQVVPTSKPEYFIGGKSPQAVSSTNHQDALLRLLTQTTARSDGTQHKFVGSTVGSLDTPTKPLPESVSATPKENSNPSLNDVKASDSSRRESPIRFFGSSDNATPTPFQPVVSPKADSSEKTGSIFTYVNPFEQLAASSPRNAKSKIPANGDRRKIKSPSPAAAHASARRKLTPSASEVLQSIETPTVGRPRDERSQIEALIGIGAPTRDAETVAKALNEVGEKVDQQVESALAKAEEKSEAREREPEIKEEEADQETLKKMRKLAHNSSIRVKEEPQKHENQTSVEESVPAPVNEEDKDVVDEAATEKNPDEWESADGDDTTGPPQDPLVVEVHQFPMRPFVSIDLIQKELAQLKMREDAVMHVARFKKEFDQADRTLATASNEFIVYGMPKTGGIRVIQQDNGTNNLLFSGTQDRIFNVAVSSAPNGTTLKSIQTIIATGVSGTVYWSTIARPDEQLTQEDMEKTGLIIPPTSSQLDSGSGGQLKTRAKKSNRHPEFFAIGRGRSIQIIFTANARNSEFVSKEGLMNTEQYFADRNLKITTGKAGKDFVFSEDDSVIASLDKAGKLRLWDIRDLVNDANDAVSLLTPIEVKTPILTFTTAHSNEKTWPTSVLFVDKMRPYTKGTALRYIVVGMKQNHTLQLWDLCLGKAVQELSFPHNSESDPICSVTYHAASGIIAVGHPARNSIYFIHLSAPKYNLPGMSQAKFIQRLANKDSTLPKAEATAIMSGVREYSFADKGQIRSVELVSSAMEAPSTPADDDDPTLFELYVLHSKGVTCLGIKREDLGWSKDSKVLHPIDAEKEGLIVIKELRELSSLSVSEHSVSTNGESQAPATPSRTKTFVKDAAKMTRPPNENRKSTPAPTEKADKKKNKQHSVVDAETVSQEEQTPSTSMSYASAIQRAASPVKSAPSATARDASQDTAQTKPVPTTDRTIPPIANGDSINVGISGDFLDKELKKIERGVSEEFNKVIGRELEALYKRFSEDKRVQDAAGAAKQDAMLRLVSSTLSENVEASLSRIIRQSIQETVIPSITDVTASAINANISKAVAQQIDGKMSAALKQALPEAISRSVQTPQILRSIAEHVTKTVTGHVEQQFSATLNKDIIPAFTNLAVSVAEKINGDTERRVREQLQQADIKHREDSVKIDQLTMLVRGLSETVQTMATAQTEFQLEILKQQQKIAEGKRTTAGQHSPTPSESASMNASPEQEELDSVTHAMNEGRFEEATVMVRRLLVS